MKKIKVNINKITKEQIDVIIEHLQQGKVIAYPTDTIYGLGCLATDKKAIKMIYKIKQRNKSTPLLILVGSYTMLKKYCYVNKLQYEYLKNIWPSPISAILRKRKTLPEALTGGMKSVAVRLPKNKFLIKIIKRAGKPIVSTSINISGRKSLTDVDNIEKYFGAEKPDLVVDAGELKGKPSRLIDVRDVDDIKILRKS